MDDDYGARIRKAHREWQDAHDPETLSWAQVQQKCMVILGKPDTSVAVLKWKDGVQEPTIAEFRAIGQVLGVDPRDLAFGPRDAPQSAEDAPGRGVDRVERGRDVLRETPVDKAARRKRRTS